MNKSDGYSTVVRIMGQGQFKVGEGTVKKINKVDDAIVQILQNESKADDQEFRTKVTEIVQTITLEGQKLDDKELIESDIIVPDIDISIDQAKRVFQGEGIIPEL